MGLILYLQAVLRPDHCPGNTSALGCEQQLWAMSSSTGGGFQQRNNWSLRSGYMVQVRTGSYLLWGCEGQRLDVSGGQGSDQGIPAADLYRWTVRLHSVSPHNYLQALINPCFIEQAIFREVFGEEPLGHVPFQLSAAAAALKRWWRCPGAGIFTACCKEQEHIEETSILPCFMLKYVGKSGTEATA